MALSFNPFTAAYVSIGYSTELTFCFDSRYQNFQRRRWLVLLLYGQLSIRRSGWDIWVFEKDAVARPVWCPDDANLSAVISGIQCCRPPAGQSVSQLAMLNDAACIDDEAAKPCLADGGVCDHWLCCVCRLPDDVVLKTAAYVHRICAGWPVTTSERRLLQLQKFCISAAAAARTSFQCDGLDCLQPVLYVALA